MAKSLIRKHIGKKFKQIAGKSVDDMITRSSDDVAKAASKVTAGPKIKSGPTQEEINLIMSRKPKSLDEYASKRFYKKQAEIKGEQGVTMAAIDSGSKDAEKLYSKFNVGKGNKDELTSKVADHYNTAYNANTPTPTMMDRVGYHQVPQKAAAIGGTAWLVSKLSATNGRQTNAQLYSGGPK